MTNIDIELTKLYMRRQKLMTEGRKIVLLLSIQMRNYDVPRHTFKRNLKAFGLRLRRRFRGCRGIYWPKKLATAYEWQICRYYGRFCYLTGGNWPSTVRLWHWCRWSHHWQN